MPRQGTGSGLLQDRDRGPAGTGPDTSEPALETFDAEDDDAVPPSVDAETIDAGDRPEAEIDADNRPAAEIPPLQITPKRKRAGGMLPLILIAILGMVIGFIVIMLI